MRKRFYVCSLCGKKNVKLWRPYMCTAPLICAECAEKRQSIRECKDGVWEKDDKYYIKRTNEKIITLPKWKINEKGKIPSPYGPGPEGLPESMTDQLTIDLSDLPNTCFTNEVTMVPACPTEDGSEFYGYTSVPDDVCKWWDNLPTS